MTVGLSDWPISDRFVAMQVTVRRLTVIGAAALCSAIAGVALGNFVAGSERRSGTEELADYGALMAPQNEEDGTAQPRFARDDGPSSYDCQGCDAHLYPQDEAVDAPYVEPPSLYPAYSVYPSDDVGRPAAPVVQSIPAPVRDAPVRDSPPVAMLELKRGVSPNEAPNLPVAPVPVEAE